MCAKAAVNTGIGAVGLRGKNRFTDRRFESVVGRAGIGNAGIDAVPCDQIIGARLSGSVDKRRSEGSDHDQGRGENMSCVHDRKALRAVALFQAEGGFDLGEFAFEFRELLFV